MHGVRHAPKTFRAEPGAAHVNINMALVPLSRDPSAPPRQAGSLLGHEAQGEAQHTIGYMTPDMGVCCHVGDGLHAAGSWEWSRCWSPTAPGPGSPSAS